MKNHKFNAVHSALLSPKKQTTGPEAILSFGAQCFIWGQVLSALLLFTGIVFMAFSPENWGYKILTFIVLSVCPSILICSVAWAVHITARVAGILYGPIYSFSWKLFAYLRSATKPIYHVLSVAIFRRLVMLQRFITEAPSEVLKLFFKASLSIIRNSVHRWCDFQQSARATSRDFIYIFTFPIRLFARTLLRFNAWAT